MESLLQQYQTLHLNTRQEVTDDSQQDDYKHYRQEVTDDKQDDYKHYRQEIADDRQQDDYKHY